MNSIAMAATTTTSTNDSNSNNGSSLTPLPFQHGSSPKAASTGITTAHPTSSNSNGNRARSSSADQHHRPTKLFKVFKYVDQDLLEDSARMIELLRQENLRLKQKMQLQERALGMLQQSNDKHVEANSLSRQVLQSLLKQSGGSEDDDGEHHHHHPLVDAAYQAQEDALRLDDLTQAMLEALVLKNGALTTTRD